jgi:hypothetical protein
MGERDQLYCVECQERVLETQPGQWRHDTANRGESHDLDDDHKATPDYGDEDLQ